MLHPVRFFLPAALAACALAAPPAAFDAERYKADVKTLASPAMKGRGTGSPQLEKAAKFLASEFKKAGIPPAPGAPGYFQRFEVTVNAELGKNNSLKTISTGATAGTTVSLSPGKDFLPFNFSANDKVSGPLVFAGYGITAPEYNYDDYAGLDVKDKIVIVLRHEPQEFDEKSVFAGKVYTRHAQTEFKAVNAKMHGARAVLFVNDVANHTDPDELDKFSRRVGPGLTSVPFLQVRAALVEQWLQPTLGKSLKEWIAEVDKDLKPRGAALPATLTAELSTDVRRQTSRVPNVAAYLPGETSEYLIVGAHFDHIGMGEQSSMSPDLAGKAIHHGADDNASGSAGLLALARWAKQQPKLKRGLLFLAFSGEELGLLGSAHYVNQPLLPLDQAVAMINMDMIGRIKDAKVFIGGTNTGSSLKALIEGIQPNTSLKLELSDQGGFGSSDHFSFITKQVPVLFFFSGLHQDYHRPSDTWEKINSTDAAALLTVVASSIQTLSTAERPKFVRVSAPAPQATASASSSRGYGAYFGSVPDMSSSGEGFRVSDVNDASPAQKAGLKGGDVIIEFDGKPIKNLYDFTYALQARKPGDEVVIKYKRDGKEFDTKATLATRKR
jgi:hypothetical protein